jgi:hypothetical protein
MKQSCPKCGSSDARHVYQDHSFCFSCRTRFMGNRSPYTYDQPVERSEDKLHLPDDCSHDYPSHVLAWTGKYVITIEELIKHNVYYSKQRDQLVFSWKDEDGHLLCWQARNFSPTAKAKCFTQGPVSEVLPIYPVQVSNVSTLVLVEDPLSAIKVSRFSHAMPCLGSDLPKDKIKRLADVLGPFLGVSEVVVWLDSDMLSNAKRLADRFKLLGVASRVVYTEFDPKEYDDKTIQSLIQGGLTSS